MGNRTTVAMFCLGSAMLGAVGALAWQNLQQARPSPNSTAIISQVREVARLQTLEVTLHKKIQFEPPPQSGDGVWQDVWHWAQQALRPSRGKVIVFAVARLGLDMRRLGPDALRVDGHTAFMVLPPMQVDVELLPGETEVIGSNLDTAQTADLMETARQAFTREVQQDVRLKERARAAAQRALTGLLLSLGFEHVQFVDTLAGAATPASG